MKLSDILSKEFCSNRALQAILNEDDRQLSNSYGRHCEKRIKYTHSRLAELVLACCLCYFDWVVHLEASHHEFAGCDKYLISLTSFFWVNHVMHEQIPIVDNYD